MSHTEAINKAIGMSKQDGYVDVVKLASEYDIPVYNKTLEDDRSGFIKYEDGKFSIVANSNQTKQRQRFSIAHELAHFLLHPEEVKKRGMVDRAAALSLTPEEERRADQLAADILMPEQIVREYVMEKGWSGTVLDRETILNIADKFNVSFPMAAIRLRELDYYVPYISF
jgi:Zn-dependent peptidase ImmA (M78 family)